MVTLTAAVLFFTTGGLIIEPLHKNSISSGYLFGSGVTAILAGFAYFLDCLITISKS
jgi:hypothetical protein